MLVVAGHDPTGGAGIDADRRAAARFGARTTAIVTAETEQDGQRVFEVRPRDPAQWLAEALAVTSVDAIKIGLLPGAEHVRAVVELARARRVPLVVDPVLASSGGTPFLDTAGQRALLEELLPLGPVLTPNLPEALLLAGAGVAGDGRAARLAAAARLVELGARVVLLKGGHGREDPVQDLVFVADAAPVWLARPRVAGASLHGSGCRFASAVAAQVAAGAGWVDAARAAGEWLADLLAGRTQENR